MKAELELRARLKQVESEMEQISGRVKRIDEVLNHNLTVRHDSDSRSGVQEYLAWLDRVEALGLAFVNANIVTQRLRLFYQAPQKSRGRISDPTPRMREVKNLLETVRHSEQSDLLLLRARRHALQTDIQSLVHVRKSNGEGLTGAGRGGQGVRSIGWLPLGILLLALLVGSVLLDAFRPEIVHFIRSHVGLRDTVTGAAAGAAAGAAPRSSLPPSRAEPQ